MGFANKNANIVTLISIIHVFFCFLLVLMTIGWIYYNKLI